MNFLVLPDIRVHFGGSTNAAHQWSITGVVCQQCTRTEMFTNNADQVATHVQSRMIMAGQS
jgi:hypothetical protein